MSDPRRHQGWIGVGGRETLQSYAIDSERYLKSGDFSGLRNAMLKNIPPHHVAFLERLAICAQTPTHLFVHAGLRPGRALENQTDSDLMWIREPFLSKGPQLPITVVHGHTMTAQPVFEKQRIGIDTGAFMTGNLTVVRIFGGACEVI
jgi:serine/threonine protein phosphatase 1